MVGAVLWCQRWRWLPLLLLVWVVTSEPMATRPAENMRRRIVIDENNSFLYGDKDYVKHIEENVYWERHLQVFDSLENPSTSQPPNQRPTNAPAPIPTNAPIKATIAPQTLSPMEPTSFPTPSPLSKPSNPPGTTSTLTPTKMPIDNEMTTTPLPGRTPSPSEQSSVPVALPSTIGTPAPSTMSPNTTEISSAPSQTPSTGPSQFPVPVPTPDLTEPPSLVPQIPVVPPSAVPTVMPVPTFQNDTFAPSSDTNTTVPTLLPSDSQGLVCELDLELGCISEQNNTSCEAIPSENQFICLCAECARELVFQYSGNSCDGLENCQDEEDGPVPSALLLITTADENLEVIFSGRVTAGDIVVVDRGDGSCIPGLLRSEVIDPTSGVSLQTLTMDTSCINGGLQLLQSYGAIDFWGYSCDSNDVHNCVVDVLYELDACNTGFVNLTLDALSFRINGTGADYYEIDILNENTPNEGLILSPFDCYRATVRSTVEICMDNDYTATASVVGTTDGDGSLCNDDEKVSFGWVVATLPPSSTPRTPRPVPTPSPADILTSVPTRSPELGASTAPITQLPEPIPSIRPSSPSETTMVPSTSACDLDLSLQCVTLDAQTNCTDIVGEENLSCQCVECAQELIFVYTARPCDDSQSTPGECFDNLAPASPARLQVMGSETSDVLFDAVVEFGDNVVIQNDGRCLPNELSVKVLPADGNEVLQTLSLNATCDGVDALILLNSYGSLEFIGYDCGELDSHNCFVDVSYLISTCNENAGDQLVFEMDFELNGTVVDLLVGNSPRTLQPTECFQSFIPSVVERCSERDYFSSVLLNASSAFTGPFCTAERELVFSTSTNTTNGIRR